MGKKSSPPPPDYTAAAIASGESSKEVTEQQTWANRPDQITPWGSETWTNKQVYDPFTGQNLNRWTQTTNLTREAQEALDSQLRLQNQRSQLGENLYGRMESEYGTPMDWEGLQDWGGLLQGGDAARQRAEDALYSRATARLDPQWENAQADKEAQLAAQGLRSGDAAYDRAMNEFNMARTDAYDQARTGAITGGGQEATRQQAMDQQASNYMNTLRAAQLAEAQTQRGWTLNEMNAILSGQQVGMPNMPNFNQANAAQAVDYMGAADKQYSGALDQYSAKQAGQQGLMSGIGSIASIAMMSDSRLKKDILPIGKFGKFNLYAYTYIWGEKAIGVMADEVKKILPEAVIRHSSGYDMVDYTKVLKEV